MAGSRKSTPRRGRSSSVVSNVSTSSTNKQDKKTSTPRRATRASSAVQDETDDDKSVVSVASPTKGMARPALPKKRNPILPDYDVPVKLQIIQRDGKNIIIGRVKLPTVNHGDHAFLLKRFDTNAIAASSMFRLAFPYADGEAERQEMAYLENNFDADLANGGVITAPKRGRGRVSKKALEAEEANGSLPKGSTGVRLQGTWIPCADASAIAEEYHLSRFALPLIEAKASQGEGGQPILTPSRHDKVSTPSSTKASRKSRAKEDAAGPASSQDSSLQKDATASPTVVRTRTTKRAREDGTEEITVERSETTLTQVSKLSSEEIAAQIAESQSLAKGIAASNGKASTSTPSKKRRAVNQAASGQVDLLADDEYEAASNPVVRSIRRGGRAVRRRPIITTAGALGAAGAGALAWISGGNLDVATQLVQQGVAQFGSYFFY